MVKSTTIFLWQILLHYIKLLKNIGDKEPDAGSFLIPDFPNRTLKKSKILIV